MDGFFGFVRCMLPYRPWVCGVRLFKTCCIRSTIYSVYSVGLSEWFIVDVVISSSLRSPKYTYISPGFSFVCNPLTYGCVACEMVTYSIIDTVYSAYGFGMSDWTVQF